MRFDRHVLVALCMLTALGCTDADPFEAERSCEDMVILDAPVPIHDEDTAVTVCGDGLLRVLEDGEVRTLVNAELRLDEDGAVLDAQDRPILGVSAGSPTLTPAVVPTEVPGMPTRAATIAIRLSADTPTSGPFDPSSPFETSDFHTSVTLFTMTGEPVEVDIVFVRHGGGRWEVHALSERDVADVPADLGRMDLVFNASGALTSVTGGPLLHPRKHDNAEPWTLAFDTSRTVSYRASPEIYGFEQDGRSPGDLLELTLSARGELTAEYSNGMTVSAAWVLDGIEGWIARPE